MEVNELPVFMFMESVVDLSNSFFLLVLVSDFPCFYGCFEGSGAENAPGFPQTPVSGELLRAGRGHGGHQRG